MIVYVVLKKNYRVVVFLKKKVMICIGLCKLDWYIVVWFVELIFIFFKNDGCVFVKRKFYEIYKNNIYMYSKIWWWWFDCLVCNVILDYLRIL